MHFVSLRIGGPYPSFYSNTVGQSVHQEFSGSLLAQESFCPILGNLLKGAKKLLSLVFLPLFAASFLVRLG